MTNRLTEQQVLDRLHTVNEQHQKDVGLSAALTRQHNSVLVQIKAWMEPYKDDGLDFGEHRVGDFDLPGSNVKMQGFVVELLHPARAPLLIGTINPHKISFGDFGYLELDRQNARAFLPRQVKDVRNVAERPWDEVAFDQFLLAWLEG